MTQIDPLLLAGSTLLPATGVLGNWMIKNHRPVGWLMTTLVQLPWAAFGLLTGQWGYIGWGIAYFVMNGSGWLKWRREEREKRDGDGVRGEDRPVADE